MTASSVGTTTGTAGHRLAASHPSMIASVVWRQVDHTKQWREWTAVKINAQQVSEPRRPIADARRFAGGVKAEPLIHIPWIGGTSRPSGWR
jgi:hypothetical protein